MQKHSSFHLFELQTDNTLLSIYKAIKQGPPNTSSSSDNNIGVIIGVVAAAMVIIIAIILIVACFLHRKRSGMNNQRDVVNIQNAAYKGDKQPQRKLPNIPYSNSGYEEPSDYAQLDSSKRVPMDANYQSLKPKNKQSASDEAADYAVLERENENEQRYTSLQSNHPAGDYGEGYVTIMSGNEAAGKESLYEELP